MVFQNKKFLDENGLTRFASNYPTNEVLGTVINAIDTEYTDLTERVEILEGFTRIPCISINPPETTIFIINGATTFQLPTLNVNPSDTTDLLSFETLNPSIATVNSTGLVTYYPENGFGWVQINAVCGTQVQPFLLNFKRKSVANDFYISNWLMEGNSLLKDDIQLKWIEGQAVNGSENRRTLYYNTIPFQQGSTVTIYKPAQCKIIRLYIWYLINDSYSGNFNSSTKTIDPINLETQIFRVNNVLPEDNLWELSTSNNTAMEWTFTPLYENCFCAILFSGENDGNDLIPAGMSWEDYHQYLINNVQILEETTSNAPTIITRENQLITILQQQINLKANINSPSLTGIPTAPTAAAGTNNTQVATTEFVMTAIQTIKNI